MHPLARNILAGLVAFGAALLAVFIIELLWHQSLGRPMLSTERPLPAVLFLGPLLAYGAGAFISTFITAHAADLRARRPMAAGLVALLGLLALTNLMWFAHPIWFVPAIILVLFAGWRAGGRTGHLPQRRSQRGQQSIASRS